MGNCNNSCIVECCFDNLLNSIVSLLIDIRSCFVHHQDFWLPNHGAGQTDQLLLPNGHITTAKFDIHVEPKFSDFFLCLLAIRRHFLRSGVCTIFFSFQVTHVQSIPDLTLYQSVDNSIITMLFHWIDIVFYGTVENAWVLGDHRNISPLIMQAHLPNVNPVYENSSLPLDFLCRPIFRFIALFSQLKDAGQS